MKCESCGCYDDECEEIDGMLLCESCKQRRYETKEYVISEKNSDVEWMERQLAFLEKQLKGTKYEKVLNNIDRKEVD